MSKRAVAAFVPRLLGSDATKLQIVTTNCGSRLEHLDAERVQSLFAELSPWRRHGDPPRNVTYRHAYCSTSNWPRSCRVLNKRASHGASQCFLKWSGRTDRVRFRYRYAFLALQFDAKEVLYSSGKNGEASTQHADFAFAVSDGMGRCAGREMRSWIAVEGAPPGVPCSHPAIRLFGLEAGFADAPTESVR